MNAIQKILDHIFKGTLMERIKMIPEIRREKKWRSLIKKNIKSIVVARHGVKFKLYTDSVLSRVIYRDTFENNELSFLEKWIKPNDNMIDIGSNFGIYSLIGSKLNGPSGKVFAFEPTVSTYKWLVENIELNGQKNIHAFNMALSDKKETLNLIESTDGFDAWNSFVKPVAGKKFKSHLTEAITLDDFLKTNDLLNKISYIKIDVEGWELKVLKGSTELLSSENPPVLMVEFTEANARNADSSCADIYNYMIGFGFSWYSYDAKKNNLLKEKLRDEYPYSNLFAIKDLDKVTSRLNCNLINN